MNLNCARLSRHPQVFRSLTGVSVADFEGIVEEVEALVYAQLEAEYASRKRQRAVGGGRNFELEMEDQILATLIWLRCYPKQEVLAYLFGVHRTTMSRAIERVLPVLAQTGRDGMAQPKPSRKRTLSYDDLLRIVPGLTEVVDTFEQRIQRPSDPEAQKRYYSGKKKQHTLKTQVRVDLTTGYLVGVSASVPGSTHDLSLYRQTAPVPTVPTLADLGYFGHPTLITPRRKPRKRDRPPQDRTFNHHLARLRVVVEHSINRLRRFASLSQTDRHHRRFHHDRVCACAGLVNRRLRTLSLFVA